MMRKICSMCKEEKALSSFDRRSDTKDKLQYGCRDCQKRKTKTFYQKKSKKIKKKQRMKSGAKKLCNTCDLWKPLEDFHVRSESIDGRQYVCKVCHNAAIDRKRNIKKSRNRTPVGALSLTQARQRNVHHLMGCVNLFEFRNDIEAC